MGEVEQREICEYLIRDLFPDGRAVAVPVGGGKIQALSGPLPGDRISYEQSSGRITYLETSPDRRPAFCPAWPRCGGCSVQELAYDRVLELKERHLQHLFPDLKVGFSGMPEPVEGGQMAYRHKYFWHWQGGRFGLLERGSHKLVELDSCPLARPEINRALAIFQELFSEDIGQAGLHLRVGKPGQISFLLVFNRQAKNYNLQIRDYGPGIHQLELKDLGLAGKLLGRLKLSFKQADLELRLSGINLRDAGLEGENLGRQTLVCPELSGQAKWQDLLLEQEVLDREFKILPGAFFQVNPEMFAASCAWARSRIARPKKALDLFCGTGAWGLSVLPKTCSYFGLELDRLALETAALNAQINGFSQADFRRLNLVREQVDLSGVDLLLLDPPRAGLTKALARTICQQEIPQILYLSCHPASLARDIKRLSGSYRVVDLHGFDYFPWTMGYEALALLNFKQN